MMAIAGMLEERIMEGWDDGGRKRE